LIICNPNNPTSNQFEKNDVLTLIEAFPGIVLVDEAYAEFGEYSLVSEAENHENLVILRTFSKAFGMAGLRLGYGVTNKKLATIFNEKYLSPYPLSSIALNMGVDVLQRKQLILQTVEEIKETRKWLETEMNKIKGVKAFPSSTSFVLASLTKNFEEVYQRILDQGILIRKVGQVPGFADCIRVTVAPRDKLECFISALKEAMS
jgi:histidinol-phosphate aminotransferase